MVALIAIIIIVFGGSHYLKTRGGYETDIRTTTSRSTSDEVPEKKVRWYDTFSSGTFYGTQNSQGTTSTGWTSGSQVLPESGGYYYDNYTNQSPPVDNTPPQYYPPNPVVTPGSSNLTPTASSLEILNVSISPGETTARVSWNTNIVTQSAVTFRGVEHFSSGVSTSHTVTLTGLAENTSHQATIAASSGGAWEYKNISFTTKTLEPINLTLSKSSISQNNESIVVTVTGSAGESFVVRTIHPSSSSNTSTTFVLDGNGKKSYTLTGPSQISSSSIACDDYIYQGVEKECVWYWNVEAVYSGTSLKSSKTVTVHTGRKTLDSSSTGDSPSAGQ